MSYSIYNGKYALLGNQFAIQRDVPTQFIVALGGTITLSGDYKTHTFLDSTNFQIYGLPADPVEIRCLIIAGGGAGGFNFAGGGGAGGFQDVSILSTSLNPGLYPIEVGDGGYRTIIIGTGKNGGNSSALGIESIGGGGGGGYSYPSGNGGSGGGSFVTDGSFGIGVIGQGYNGGSGLNGAAGGGGSSENGKDGGPPYEAGGGGNGLYSDITDVSIAYCGGGGGGNNFNQLASGGIGGGGRGGWRTSPYGGIGEAGEDASIHSGSGGGGGGGNDGHGGSGGKGIVILKYKYK